MVLNENPLQIPKKEIQEALDVAISEWSKSITDKSHIAHCESPITEFKYRKEIFPTKAGQTGHFIKILDDLVYRPIWKKVVAELSSEPIKREKWAYNDGQNIPCLYQRTFIQEHLPQVDLKIIDSAAQRILEELGRGNQFGSPCVRYGARNEGRYKIIDLGKLTRMLVGDLEDKGYNTVTDNPGQFNVTSIDQLKWARHRDKLISSGIVYEGIPHGREIDITDAQVEHVVSGEKSELFPEAEYHFEEEQLIRDVIKAQLKSRGKHTLSRNKFRDEVRTYFTGPTQIEEKWEVLGAYMAGSIFPKTGIYDEQSTAIIVEESDMQLGSNLLPRDFTILTDRMLRELIKFGDKSQPVTLYSSSTQNQISYGFRGKHLPPSELLPFTFTSSYRSGLIERILNDTKGEEKPDNYGFTPSWDDDY